MVVLEVGFMLEKFYDVFFLLYGIPIWAISVFCRKKKGRWAFGALRGQKYCDNTRHLFEAACEFKGLDCAWIAQSAEVVKYVRDQGYNAYSCYSLKGLWHVMTSEAAFYTHRGYVRDGDLPFYAMSNKVFRVQTWHGIPLKKIAYDDEIFSTNPNHTKIYETIICLATFCFPYLKYVNDPDLILALSEETKSVFAGAFRVDREKVVITGYPRNDQLVKAKECSASIKKIIYMPTFRGDYSEKFDPLSQYGFDLNKLEKNLEDNGYTFHIKLHPFNLPASSMIEAIGKSKFIFLIDEVDIYSSLCLYDVLVTDYSSVYFDFLLLNKPIVFTPFDYDSYVKNERQFYYSYNDVTPGPKAKDWENFLEILSNLGIACEGYSALAQELKKRFHCYDDNHSSKRVLDVVLNRLNR